MCGIAGIVNFKEEADIKRIKSMCDCMQRRGPDAEGIYIKDNIALGHRRLSVIDIESGNQPMFSDDGNIVIVFNGEIYNFKKLRNELESLSQKFSTKSDTEVIIKGYEVFGLEGLLEKIEGMYAFALYDKNKKELYVVRDKFGEKPLFYSIDNSRIIFASELKALENQIEKKIDQVGLNFFLSLSYIPAPHTIYENVKKLKQGCYLKISVNGKISIHQYYNLARRIKGKDKITDFETAKNKIKKLLYESVADRMVSDVPLGAFLSGGVDSSIISVIMSEISGIPVNTFSIGFIQKEYDESERAKLVADKIKSNHTVHFLDYKDVITLIDEIILYYDEPFGDSSAIPSYYVAKLAREKVTVVLTGDCADELFGGYEKYLAHWYSEKFKKLPTALKSIFKSIVYFTPHTGITNSILRRVKKVISNSSLSDFDLHFEYMCLGFNDDERKKLLHLNNYKEIKPVLENVFKSYDSDDILEKELYTDVNIVLEGDMLTKVDRVCMMNSLESRAPFLDSKLVETVFLMPSKFKINGKEKKFILKETFKDILPGETVNYRKKGFGVPVDYWFKNQLKTNLEEVINKNFIESQGLFNFSYIEKLFSEHMTGEENHKGKLWNLYVFQKWYINKIL